MLKHCFGGAMVMIALLCHLQLMAKESPRPFGPTHMVRPEPFLTPQQLASYIPTNFRENASEGQILRKILDRSLRTLFKRPQLRRHSVVRLAKTLENRVATDFELGAPEPGQIRHKLKFRLRAFETKASVRYSGLVDARFSYTLSKHRAHLKLWQQLDDLTQISVNLSSEPGESKSLVELQLSY